MTKQFNFKKILAISLLAFAVFQLSAQDTTHFNNKKILDSIYIFEVQDKYRTDKVLHAEPLYIDLIRDLGARKGEKEWNYAFGLNDNDDYDEYEALVEYEFAPIDRLGLEIELPMTIYGPASNNGEAPSSKLNSVKLAAQYTFLVSEPAKTSLAFGYLHEFELTEFKSYGRESLYTGNIFNPFFIAAKRWGNNYHTLVYTGPQYFQHFDNTQNFVNWQVNTNFHYMISGTRNFIGIEVNKDIRQGEFEMVLRPQMRVAITNNLLIGIVTGIPVTSTNNRLSTFLRLIYEPGH